MPRIDWNKLNDLRREAADREWGRYEFGDAVVDEKGGWEHMSGSGVKEWTRPVYFANSEDEDGPTARGYFTVVFLPETNEVMDVYAGINGNDVGQWPGPSGFVPAPTPLLQDEEDDAGIDASAPAAADELGERRGVAADDEFANYDFEDWTVDETEGWERTTEDGETLWRRAVYFANPNDPEGDTVRGDFNVIFEEGSDAVLAAYAGVNGNDIGQRMSVSPKP